MTGVLKYDYAQHKTTVLLSITATKLPFYGHYTRQPALAGMSSKELEDFVGAKFHCPHPNCNQCIMIIIVIIINARVIMTLA